MAIYKKKKSSVEHIARVQPRSCMLLDSCLYVLSTCLCYLYMHRGCMHRGCMINFAGREGLCDCSDFVAIKCAF